MQWFSLFFQCTVFQWFCHPLTITNEWFVYKFTIAIAGVLWFFIRGTFDICLWLYVSWNKFLTNKVFWPFVWPFGWVKMSITNSRKHYNKIKNAMHCCYQEKWISCRFPCKIDFNTFLFREPHSRCIKWLRTMLVAHVGWLLVIPGHHWWFLVLTGNIWWS